MKCQWGPVDCLISESLISLPWTMWQWKLDAYVTPAATGDSCASLIISKSEYDGIENRSDKVFEERSGFYSRQIFRQPDGSMLWLLTETRTGKSVLAYRVSGNFDRIELLKDDTQTAGQAAFEYMSRMAVYSAINSGVVTFHGALVEYNGNGIIIAAPSETGKTTHARLWRDSLGAIIINGDNSCCFLKNGVWTGFGIPWCGTSGENINRSVPICALVTLERSETNKVEKLDGMEAFKETLPVLQCPVWDTQLSEKSLNGLDSFINDVPVYRLKCRPDRDSVETLKKALNL
ncbi:MAG: hypothetical protein PUB20_07980 [Clostridia bacterium]|nr:hypothetical protein [Clostridia bacterium]